MRRPCPSRGCCAIKKIPRFTIFLGKPTVAQKEEEEEKK